VPPDTSLRAVDGSGRVDTEAVRREHPTADLVASYGIELRRIGAALVGRCPFHEDGGRPNLHVYRSGRWVCYRCGEFGDVIGFVQRIDKLSFRDAVARLKQWPISGAETRRRRAHPEAPYDRARPDRAFSEDEVQVSRRRGPLREQQAVERRARAALSGGRVSAWHVERVTGSAMRAGTNSHRTSAGADYRSVRRSILGF
jgi:hypothetical protein